MARTPPSHVFNFRGKWFPLPLSGTKSLPNHYGEETRIIELYGWLSGVAEGCNAETGGNPPDWHYELVLDPDWIFGYLGISVKEWNRLFPVGTVLFSGGITESVVTELSIHIELNGLYPSQYEILKAQGVDLADWEFHAGDCGGQGAWWAYNPLQPPSATESLKVGQYVKMIGSIVTDEPHFDTAGISTWIYKKTGIVFTEEAVNNVLKKAWGRGMSADDPNNPSRWVELHPPNAIEVVKDDKIPPKKGTFWGIAVYADNGLFSGDKKTLKADLFPNAPRPAPSAIITYTESIGPESNTGTYQHQITVHDDHIHLHVDVAGEGGSGSPGKFKAIYYVGWRETKPSLFPVENMTSTKIISDIDLPRSEPGDVVNFSVYIRNFSYHPTELTYAEIYEWRFGEYESDRSLSPYFDLVSPHETLMIGPESTIELKGTFTAPEHTAGIAPDYPPMNVYAYMRIFGEQDSPSGHVYWINIAAHVGEYTLSGVQLSATEIDFGQVRISRESTQQIVLRNGSPGEIFVEPQIVPQGEFRIGGHPLPIGYGYAIDEYASEIYTITYEPVSEGKVEGHLYFNIRTEYPYPGLSEQLAIRLTAEAFSSAQGDDDLLNEQVHMYPPEIDFGIVPLGTKNSIRDAWIYNGYSDAVGIKTLSFTPPGYFSVVDDVAGFLIEPGKWQYITLVYTPTRSGSLAPYDRAKGDFEIRSGLPPMDSRALISISLKGADPESTIVIGDKIMTLPDERWIPEGITVPPLGTHAEVYPPKIDFGTIDRHERRRVRTAWVYNGYEHPIEIQSLTIAPSDFFAVEGGSTSLLLTPGQWRHITFVYSPRATHIAGTSDVALVVFDVHSSDITPPVIYPKVSLTLTGDGFA